MSSGETPSISMKRMSALSLRQPNAEQVLRGKKDTEYRNMPTSKRERVYIYANNTPADRRAWDEIGLEPGDLPTRKLVGTVEIVGCRKTKIEYEWDLAKPSGSSGPSNRRTILSLPGSFSSNSVVSIQRSVARKKTIRRFRRLHRRKEHSASTKVGIGVREVRSVPPCSR